MEAVIFQVMFSLIVISSSSAVAVIECGSWRKFLRDIICYVCATIEINVH